MRWRAIAQGYFYAHNNLGRFPKGISDLERSGIVSIDVHQNIHLEQSDAPNVNALFRSTLRFPASDLNIGWGGEPLKSGVFFESSSRPGETLELATHLTEVLRDAYIDGGKD